MFRIATNTLKRPANSINAPGIGGSRESDTSKSAAAAGAGGTDGDDRECASHGHSVCGVVAQYAGLSPDLVGLYQVNVTVPDGVQAGDAVPVTITVGNLQSQPGVTMAVQ
jgi:uncharacterized protein (TIGR03437 family)